MSVVETLSRLSGCTSVADLFFADSPAYLISGESGDVVMANPAAAAMIRAGSVGDLISGQTRMRGPAAARLSELARLDDLNGTPRLEMLRFFVGSRTVTLPFMCQRAGAPAPQPNVFAVAAAPPASALSLADKAVLAFEEDAEAIVLFDREGERIYANAAAKSGKIADRETLAALDSVSQLDLDDGDVTLFHAPADTPLNAPQPEPSIDALPDRPQSTAQGVGGAARGVVSGLASARGVNLPPAPQPVAAPAVEPAVARVEADTVADAVSAPGTQFRFTLDSEARLSQVKPALASLGLEGEVASSLDDLLTGDLTSLVYAIESRDTFNAVTVHWRAADGGLPVEATIAGLPVLDGEGGYEGLRGFAVLGARSQAPEASDEPLATVVDLPIPDRASNETAPDGADNAAAEPSDDDTHERTSMLRRFATGMAGFGAGSWLGGRSASPDDATAGSADNDDSRTQSEATVATLDDTERRAFDEIAERLNDEDDRDEPAPVTGDSLARDDDAIEKDLFDDHEQDPSGGDEDVIAAGMVTEAPRLARGRARDAQDFLSLVERLPIGLMFVRDEKPLYANRAMLDLFGYADLDDLEIAGGLPVLFESLSNAREPGKRILAGVTRDGMPIELDARLQLAPWVDGPALLLSARERLTGDDERIADLEAEIVELKDILDTATDGVVLLDDDGDILSMNRSAEALFGYESRELLGDSFATLLSDADRAGVTDYLGGLQKNGVANVLNDGREVTGLEKNGGDIPLFLTIGRVGIGRRQKFCAVLRDISNWKTASADAAPASENGEEPKPGVLAKISHEVRTPLNAIIGFADVMLDEEFGPIGNERYRGYLQDIKASGEHIISLVSNLLDLSKAEAGMMDMNFAQVRLNDVVEQCTAIMQSQANKEQVILRNSLATNLPDIVADVRSMRQILLNLISNAVKFTPPAGQVIVSTVYNEDGEVQLRVRDTGTGMSEADIEAALEPYKQARTAQRDKDSSGIGLPLTKALAEANRAGFSIESKPEQGTLVQITFPSTRVLAE